MTLTKVLTEKEFKEKCKKNGIVFTIRLWNLYVDYAWNEAMKKMGLDNHSRSAIMT